jgi:hypothetical protein
MALNFIIGVLEGVRDGSPLDQTLAFCAFVGFLALPANLLYARHSRGVNALKEKNAGVLAGFFGRTAMRATDEAADARQVPLLPLALPSTL